MELSLQVAEFACARCSELQSISSAVVEGERVSLKRRSRSHKGRVDVSSRRGYRRRRARNDVVVGSASDPRAMRPSSSSRRVLETHAWHAKRFEMAVVGSCWVGLARRDRGLRAAYRSFAEHCIAWDATFENCVQGDAEEETKTRSGESSEASEQATRRELFGEMEHVNRFRLEGPKASWTASQADAVWDGAELWAPRGQGRKVWNEIVMAGAHVVGIEERRHIRSVELGLATFPEDYGEGTLVRVVARGRGIPKNGDRLVVRSEPRQDSSSPVVADGVVTTAAFSFRLGKGAGIARLVFRDDRAAQNEDIRASSRWTASCISPNNHDAAAPFDVVLSRVLLR